MGREEAELHIAEAMKDMTLWILVVDDDPEIRRLVKEGLSSLEVVEASDGKEALQLVREEPPDLAITDLEMPGMDGFALLAQLRTLYPDLPVLALSDYGEVGKIQQSDFDGIIEKPLKLEEFRKSIEALLVREGPPG